MGSRAASVIGGVGGVDLDEQERVMANTETIIDLGNGVKVTTSGGTFMQEPPGPR